MTIEIVLELHRFSIEKFGGSHGIRDNGLLESAVDRPYATFGGEKLYYSPFEKCAAILESIVKNHPFVDGNKRTGWLAAVGVLKSYGFHFTLTQEEAYDFVINVASSHIEFADIVLFIELNCNSIG